MLEKLNNQKYRWISYPNTIVIDYLKKILNHNKSPIYYEIGIGVGATTLDVAKTLNNQGSIYIFSYKKDCAAIKNDLLKLGYNNIINTFCSESKTYSGYHFDMGLAAFNKQLPNFDLCYLDGGHVFHLDAPTTCLIKDLCKVNGHIIFDDYDWSLEKSPTLNPKINPKTQKDYDIKQIETCHIQIICSLFMDNDLRYKNIPQKSNRYKVYERVI